MRVGRNQIAKFLLGLLTLTGAGVVAFVTIPIVSSGIPMSKATFMLSGHPVEAVVFVLLFMHTAGIAIKLNSGWAILCGLPFLALAVLPFLQPDSKPKDFEILREQLDAQAESIEGIKSALGATSSSLATLQSTAIKQCRVCFQQTYRLSGNQCRGAQSTCSGWTSTTSNGNWTEEYVDATDRRSGPCIYQLSMGLRMQVALI